MNTNTLTTEARAESAPRGSCPRTPARLTNEQSGEAMKQELGEAVRQAEQTGRPVGVWGGLLQVVIVK